MARKSTRKIKKRPDVPEYYPRDGSFRDLLAWHLLKWGTRPDGRRALWTYNEFASVAFDPVGQDALYSQAKNVSNWVFGTSPKGWTDIEGILAALFGDNPESDFEREDLREAFFGTVTPDAERIPAISIFRIPAPIVGFIERPDLLNSLHIALNQSDHGFQGRAVVHGMGGAGKTGLILEYAARTKEQYEGGWWCSAQDNDALLSSLAELAGVLGVAPIGEVNKEFLARQALAALGKTQRPWLLVYDNVPNRTLVRDYFPPGNTKLVVTSRSPDWSQDAATVQVGVFSRNRLQRQSD